MFPISNQESTFPEESLHNHATELNFLVPYEYTSSEQLNLPVFNDGEASITTDQPRRQNLENEIREQHTSQRRPIPVSVIDWHSRNDTQFIASTGLDFLNEIAQLFVQQTVELHELQATRESEKRYVIKRSEGETLYYGVECSTNFQRTCFGSNRQFEMILYDRTQQQALEFRRRLACAACSFWCYLQVLEVWASEELIGYVKQEMSFGIPCFTGRDFYNNILYRIEGVASSACIYAKEANFKIYSGDGMTQLGSINHHWDQVQVDYKLCIQFPSPNISNKHKAILLGAAFLLEYMYFESARSGRCSCVC